MDNDYIITPDGELYHWGILGMKWGVRRYQNKDGSLTKKGKARYKEETEKLKERERIIKNKERAKAMKDKLDSKKAELDARQKALDDAEKAEKEAKKGNKVKKTKPSDNKPKSIEEMTDEELVKAINRARLEETMRQISQDNAPDHGKPSRPKPNAKFITKFVDEAVKPGFITGGRSIIQSAMQKIGDSFLDKTLNKDKGDGTPPVKTWDDLIKKRQYDDETARRNKQTQSSASTNGSSNSRPSSNGSNWYRWNPWSP